MVTAREIVHVYYETGHTAKEAYEAVQKRLGTNAISIKTVYQYFLRLKNGEESLEDKPRSGRPRSKKRADVLALVKETPALSLRKLSQFTGLAKSTVWDTLYESGRRTKRTRWLPHKLTPAQTTKRLTTVKKLILRNSYAPFLARLVTGDEKWIVLDNTTAERVWLLPGDTVMKGKPPPHQKKFLLCLFWNCHGVIHYELLERGKTVDATLYCSQLTKMREKLSNLYSKITPNSRVIMLHDNARPHVAKKTQNVALNLNVEFLSHPPYSPDIAPSDYHVFRSLHHTLSGQIFESKEDVSRCLDQYISSKTADFWKRGIFSLPERWNAVVEARGEYPNM